MERVEELKKSIKENQKELMTLLAESETKEILNQLITDPNLKWRYAERCNCGSQIRHNNGGNYHDRASCRFDQDSQMFIMRSWSTCELVDYEGPWKGDSQETADFILQYQKEAAEDCWLEKTD